MSAIIKTNQPKDVQIRHLLEANKKQIEMALPKHMTPDRMLRIAMTELRKTPKLQSCDATSYLGAIIQAAQIGLEPGSALGHCYLIPYGNECQLQMGYKGMLSLAYRAERVSHVISRAVYQGDLFKVKYGLNEDLDHEPAGKYADEEHLTHVYCVVFLKNGGKIFDVMSKAEVNMIRDNIKGFDPNKNTPWVTHYSEMARKTVLRRLFKYTPASVEMERAIGLDESADAGVLQQNGAIFESESRSVANDLIDLEKDEQPADWELEASKIDSRVVK